MVVTPDDFMRLKDRLRSFAPLGSKYAGAAFDKLVAGIEPHLVITDAGGAADWYASVAQVADLILTAHGSPGTGNEHVAERRGASAGPRGQCCAHAPD